MLLKSNPTLTRSPPPKHHAPSFPSLDPSAHQQAALIVGPESMGKLSAAHSHSRAASIPSFDRLQVQVASPGQSAAPHFSPPP